MPASTPRPAHAVPLRREVRVALAAVAVVAAASGCATAPSLRSGTRAVRTRPLVVAHRGWSARAPENTLAAYRLAIEAGADMAECDVMLSADGVPVLMHDDTLDRTTDASGPVGAMTAAQLTGLDAGRWKGARWAGERVPTLQQALAVTRGRLRLVIEIKQAGAAPPVVDVIHASGVPPDDLMVISFALSAVAEAARAEPLLPTMWLIGDVPRDRDGRRRVLAQALRARASAIGTSYLRMDAELLRMAHERGLMVFVWTVNTTGAMRRMIELGVDGVETDHPDVLVDLLR